VHFFAVDYFRALLYQWRAAEAAFPFAMQAKVASMRHKRAQVGPSLDYGAKIAIKMMSGIRR
jgi:hypothetical protein